MLLLFKETAIALAQVTPTKRVAAKEWDALRESALRLMKARQCKPDSLEHLATTPYELWRAIDWDSRIEMLFYKVGIERYAEIEREHASDHFHKDQTYPAIASALEGLGRPIRYIGVDVDAEEKVVGVPSPRRLAVTSDTVEAALKDAEMLIRTTGPANALDRACTAFQAYLEQVCHKEGIPVSANTNIPTLLGQIRQNHRKLRAPDPQVEQMTTQILRGAAQIVDALNTARNKKTLAHPNPLLDEPEAMLSIHAIRMLLHYFDARFK